MDERNINLWERWTQSPRVKVLGEQGEFLIPQELLRRRSPYLLRKIDEQQAGELTAVVYLEGVNLRTLKKFYRWSLSAEPCIPNGIAQEELVELAILAEKYQVFALQHQAVDKLDDEFSDKSGSGKWNVQPEMVSRVYQECGPMSCLRRVFLEALNLVMPEQLLNEWEEWSKVAAAGGDLGTDLLKAVAKTQAAQRLNSCWHFLPTSARDSCQFHDHGRQNLTDEMGRVVGSFGQTRCQFKGMECFPAGFVKETNQDGSGVKGRKHKKGKKLIGDDAPEVSPITEEPPTTGESPMTEKLLMTEGPPIPEEPVSYIIEETKIEEDAAGYDQQAVAEPELAVEQSAPAECKDPDLEDDWGFAFRPKKKKTKKQISKKFWDDLDSPVILDQPANEVVLLENSDEWVKPGKDKDRDV